MCLCSGSLPSKLGTCVKAPIGVGFHTMNTGRKGQGDVTYPDGHTTLLYQTCPRAIKPWGHELQISTSPRTQSLSGPPTYVAQVPL